MSDKKQEFNAIDLNEIRTPEDFLALAADETLTLAQLKTLIEIHPGIVKASIEAVHALAKTSELAGTSQVEAIRTLRDAINGSLDILKILAQNAQSDTTREKIAALLIEVAKQHKELSQIIERMNSANNKLWKKVIAGIVGTAALVVGSVAVAANMKK